MAFSITPQKNSDIAQRIAWIMDSTICANIFGVATDNNFTNEIGEIQRAARMNCYTVRDGTTIIGFVDLYPTSYDNIAGAGVFLLIGDLSYRNGTNGPLLLNWLITEGKSLGYNVLYAEVDKRNINSRTLFNNTSFTQILDNGEFYIFKKAI